MMTLQTFAPPPQPSDLELLKNFASLLADPVGTKARIDEYAATCSELRGLIEGVATAQADFVANQQKAEADFQASHAAQQNDLAKQRNDFAADCAHRLAELQAKETNAANLLAQAKADAQTAADRLADLNSRIAAVRAAAA